MNRKEQYFTNYGYQIGQSIACFEHPAAGGQKVGRGAEQHCGDDIEAHFAVAHGSGIHKQAHRYRQPKQQIQYPADQRQRDAHPHDPQQVVKQADTQTQSQTSGQKDGLPPQGSGHLSGTAGPAGRQSGPDRRPRRSVRRCPPLPSDPRRLD